MIFIFTMTSKKMSNSSKRSSYVFVSHTAWVAGGRRKQINFHLRRLSSPSSPLSSSLSSPSSSSWHRIGLKRLRATAWKADDVPIDSVGCSAGFGGAGVAQAAMISSVRVSTESADYEFGRNLSRRVTDRARRRRRQLLRRSRHFMLSADNKMYLRNWLWWLCKRSRRDVCRLFTPTPTRLVHSGSFPPSVTFVCARVFFPVDLYPILIHPSYWTHYDNVRSDGHAAPSRLRHPIEYRGKEEGV